jgi:restriction endonuclease NaeI
MTPQVPIDSQLSSVAAEIQRLDPRGDRTAHVLRNTLDQLYDGQRTGRYRWDQLYNTERTLGGSLFEINLHREFKFQDGDKFNYRIAGIDVDCKYAQTLGAWIIPPEAQGHICLLVWTDDPGSRWSLGIVRVTLERLNTGGNRDREATLNQEGRDAIAWLFDCAQLPPNVLLQLDDETVHKIMGKPFCQARINELFRSATGRIIGRGVVATVAQHLDYMKRVRGNGGARTALKPEGIVILGHYSSHAAVARALCVPVPGPGDSVSVRLAHAPGPGPGVAEIDGRFWRAASPGDPHVTAPDLPNV